MKAQSKPETLCSNKHSRSHTVIFLKPFFLKDFLNVCFYNINTLSAHFQRIFTARRLTSVLPSRKRVLVLFVFAHKVTIDSDSQSLFVVPPRGTTNKTVEQRQGCHVHQRLRSVMLASLRSYWPAFELILPFNCPLF